MPTLAPLDDAAIPALARLIADRLATAGLLAPAGRATPISASGETLEVIAEALRFVRDAHRRALLVDRRMARNGPQRSELNRALAQARSDGPPADRRVDQVTRLGVELGLVPLEVVRAGDLDYTGAVDALHHLDPIEDDGPREPGDPERECTASALSGAPCTLDDGHGGRHFHPDAGSW